MKKILFILLFIPFFANAQSDAELDNLYLRESFSLQDSGVHAITEGDTLLTLEKGKEIIADSVKWDNATGGINYAGGNVGIGTSSPEKPLHININDNANLLPLLIKNDATGGGALSGFIFEIGGIETFGFFSSETSNSLRGVPNIPMTFSTNNIARMHLSGSGNFGVGNSTMTPTTTIDIQDDTEPYMTITSPAAVLQDVLIGSYGFYSRDATANSSGGLGGMRMHASADYNNTQTPSYLTFYTHDATSNSGTVLGDVTERMRIDKDGFISIGADFDTGWDLVSVDNLGIYAGGIVAMQWTEDTVFIDSTLRIGKDLVVDELVLIGTTSAASNDPALVIGRSVTGSAGVNAHAFVDESDIDRTGTIGYASYDNRITVSGTYNYDHLAGLQAAPTYNSSGSIDRILGVTFAPTISAGTVDKVIGYKVNNGSNSGTLSKYYGFYADEELTIATDNWFLYNAGATESYLEGNLGVGVEDPEINLHIRRDITAASAAQYYTALIEAKSTTNIADGFGVTLDFGINDDADVTNRIVRIGGERHGADNTGKFTVLVNDAGSFGLPKLVVDENGWTGVGDIGNGDPEGVIDAVSTTGALIVPRMTTTEKNALATVNGSIVYDTTLNAFYFYENGAWVTK